MTTNDHKEERVQEKERIIKDAEQNANDPKVDPAGTDPNRYKDMSSEKEASGDDDYKQKPKNHTTTEERMLNPDRGED